MSWRYVVVAYALLSMTGCYKYNTHLGRVGIDASPFTEPQPGTDPVLYGSTPLNLVPDLVQPETRTVWIKGHQLPNGDYVGDYPLTIIFTRGEFVHENVPDVLIPQSVKSTDGVSPTATPPTTPTVQSGQPAQTPQPGKPQTKLLPTVQEQFRRLQQGGAAGLHQLPTGLQDVNE